MYKVVVDLQAQAAYIETNGDDVNIDFIAPAGWETAVLAEIAEPGSVSGVELLGVESVVIYDKDGDEHEFKSQEGRI